MSSRSNPAIRSYLKTTLACAAFATVALLLAGAGLYWLPKVVGPAFAALSALVAFAAATIVCAGTVVIIRCKRSDRGKPDLFLELNRSREPEAIKAATATRPTRVRRWLALRLLGHDLIVGDVVEIKTWAEIRPTLDEQGCLEQLPFMAEMHKMCGQRAYVFRCVHRLFDYRKSRRMRHMDGAVLLVGAVCDGSDHGGCEATCHMIWKAAWLRRVERSEHPSVMSVAPDRLDQLNDAAVLQIGTQAPRYACQLTQLHAASRPIGKWSAANFLRPLVSGNVAPSAFLVGWLTYLFDEVQGRRKGIGFPAFGEYIQDGGGGEETRLEVGEQVVVKSSGEILATLNDKLMHRGLWFEPDMLKHCGRLCSVQAEVSRVIDIVNGEMLTMKTPAYVLRNVHFSGERQLFNAQYEPLFWRSVWLKRAEEATRRAKLGGVLVEEPRSEAQLRAGS